MITIHQDILWYGVSVSRSIGPWPRALRPCLITLGSDPRSKDKSRIWEPSRHKPGFLSFQDCRCSRGSSLCFKDSLFISRCARSRDLQGAWQTNASFGSQPMSHVCWNQTGKKVTSLPLPRWYFFPSSISLSLFLLAEKLVPYAPMSARCGCRST